MPGRNVSGSKDEFWTVFTELDGVELWLLGVGALVGVLSVGAGLSLVIITSIAGLLKLIGKKVTNNAQEVRENGQDQEDSEETL